MLLRKAINMTKNEIRADLRLAINLSKQLENQLRKIEGVLKTGDNTVIGYWFNKIRAFGYVDIDKIMKDFESEKCFANNGITNDGPDVTVPELNINDDRDIAVCIPVNGGKLIASNTCLPMGMNQVCLEYAYDDNPDTVTLATADVASGAYAKTNHIPENNRDIVLQTYADVFDEESTSYITIAFEDIVKSLTSQINSESNKL